MSVVIIIDAGIPVSTLLFFACPEAVLLVLFVMKNIVNWPCGERQQICKSFQEVLFL
ncbi:hypothetical protein [Paenibacillus abyssi]|uniref:Uncharacterized protein n=1 Tax=Paenibacillus abyssi TaxID=1340531 RepID=A0A917CIA7_9BACL|nr:hypothetical protein [Paenibacillus abyssi]GGF89282.1 hypothetical protein GCM10010916_03280 [Paenibacillus abyssi]